MSAGAWTSWLTSRLMAIYVDQGIKGDQVVDVMDDLKTNHHALPQKIRVDNGSEFISKALDK